MVLQVPAWALRQRVAEQEFLLVELREQLQPEARTLLPEQLEFVLARQALEQPEPVWQAQVAVLLLQVLEQVFQLQALQARQQPALRVQEFFFRPLVVLLVLQV